MTVADTYGGPICRLLEYASFFVLNVYLFYHET